MGWTYVAASQFETDGYRDHSSARRDLANAKLVSTATPQTRLTLIGNTQYQPETQDPARPDARAVGSRSAPGGSVGDPVRHAQDDQPACRAAPRWTMRSATHWQLHVDAYGGQRRVRQYLSFSGGGADVFGRRRRPRSRLRRHRRAAGLARRRIRPSAAADVRRRFRPPARAAQGLRQQQRRPWRPAPRRGRHRQQRRRLRAGRMGAGAGVVAHRRRAHEPRALQLRRPLHHRRRIRTTAAAQTSTTRARSPASYCHAR